MGNAETSQNLAEHVQLLGNGEGYQQNAPFKDLLEVFPNPHKKNEYTVELEFPEFTSLCPKTGQPDFAHIYLTYDPRNYCVETKSFKIYLFSFRNHGAFMEDIVNTILNDFVAKANPRKIKVAGDFNVRGGTKLRVKAVKK